MKLKSMKTARGDGNYDYVEIFLQDEISQLDRRGISACASRTSIPCIHEMLALRCEFNKSTKVPSRDVMCRRCSKGEVVHCVKMHSDGKMARNPFCAVLGPKLCQNCSVRRNREQIINDTEQILQEVGKPGGGIRATKELALLTRIRNQHNEEQLYENDVPVKMNYDDLVRGSIARNNTPDIRYLNNRKGNQGNGLQAKRVDNDDKFSLISLRTTLKRLSSNMVDNGETGSLHLPDSVDTPIYSRRQSSQIMNLSEKSGSLTDNPMEPKLDGEELTQKLSSVFEERYLPPVNRPRSTSSTVSLMEYTEKDLTSADHVASSQWGRDEVKRDQLHYLGPPLLDIKIQLSRQQMFLSDTSLPDIVNKN